MDTKKSQNNNLLIFLGSLFSVGLIISNLISGKLYLSPIGIVLPAGVFLFPIVYIIGDIIPEVYGLKTSRKIIFMGFALNLFAVLFFMITLKLPYPNFWTSQSEYQTVLGFAPRLLIASFIAFLAGSNMNAHILILLKKYTRGKFLWIRTIGSTIAGEFLDSFLFIFIAFFGTTPNYDLFQIVLAQASFKIIYETLATPFTYLIINYIKRIENIQ